MRDRLLYSFFNVPEVQKIGVYAIHNKTNNKYYIGSSINIYQRLLDHNNNGTNTQMIKDRFVYMPEEWEIIILKTFEDGSICSDDLIQWENYFIKEYDSINNGYNRRVAFNTEKSNNLLYCRHINPRKNKIPQQLGVYNRYTSKRDKRTDQGGGRGFCKWIY